MRKHLTIILPGLLALCLFGAVMFFYVVPHTKEVLISQKRDALLHVVGSVITLLDSYETQVKAGLIDPESAKSRALHRIGSMRYGPGEQAYVWVNDLSTKMLVNPFAKKLVGQNLKNYRDSEGNLLLRKIVDLARKEGQGYVTYKIHRGGQPLPDEQKLSFIKLYKPWGWVVGTGVYLAEVDVEVASLTSNLICAGFAVFALVTSATLYLIARSMALETARNNSIGELKRSEEKYRDLFHSATEGIFLIKNNVIKDVNPATERMLGYGRDQILGRHPVEFAPHRQPSGLDSRTYCEQCKGLVIAKGAQTFEWLLQHKDGRTIPTEMSISKTEREKDSFLALAKDVSHRIKAEQEREALQRQLQQAQKMEAIGTLAGGIAHDFNNILTIIQGNAEVAKLRLEKPSFKPAKQLEEIIGATQRARDLVRQILSYSRQTEIEKTIVNLNEILHETVMMLRRATARRVGIKLSCPEKPFWVRGNPTQLQQIILNIANNGIQAMEFNTAPCLLRISLHGVTQGESSELGDTSGKRCCLNFRDTGEGMNPNQIARAFDPFFTTKPAGKGTGLGLSVVYGIIKDHGGDISITSQKNLGTEVAVTFPTVGKHDAALT